MGKKNQRKKKGGGGKAGGSGPKKGAAGGKVGVSAAVGSPSSPVKEEVSAKAPETYVEQNVPRGEAARPHGDAGSSTIRVLSVKEKEQKMGPEMNSIESSPAGDMDDQQPVPGLLTPSSSAAILAEKEKKPVSAENLVHETQVDTKEILDLSNDPSHTDPTPKDTQSSDKCQGFGRGMKNDPPTLSTSALADSVSVKEHLLEAGRGTSKVSASKTSASFFDKDNNSRAGSSRNFFSQDSDNEENEGQSPSRPIDENAATLFKTRGISWWAGQSSASQDLIDAPLAKSAGEPSTPQSSEQNIEALSTLELEIVTSACVEDLALGGPSEKHQTEVRQNYNTESPLQNQRILVDGEGTQVETPKAEIKEAQDLSAFKIQQLPELVEPEQKDLSIQGRTDIEELLEERGSEISLLPISDENGNSDQIEIKELSIISPAGDDLRQLSDQANETTAEPQESTRVEVESASEGAQTTQGSPTVGAIYDLQEYSSRGSPGGRRPSSFGEPLTTGSDGDIASASLNMSKSSVEIGNSTPGIDQEEKIESLDTVSQTSDRAMRVEQAWGSKPDPVSDLIVNTALGKLESLSPQNTASKLVAENEVTLHALSPAEQFEGPGKSVTAVGPIEEEHRFLLQAAEERAGSSNRKLIEAERVLAQSLMNNEKSQETLFQEIKELKSRLDEKEKNSINIDFSNKASFGRDLVQTLEEQVRELSTRLEIMTNELEQLSATSAVALQSAVDEKSARRLSDMERDQLSRQLVDIADEVNALRVQNTRRQEKILDLESAVSLAESTANSLRTVAASVSEENAGLRVNLEAIQFRADEMSATIESLTAERTALANSLADAQLGQKLRSTNGQSLLKIDMAAENQRLRKELLAARVLANTATDVLSVSQVSQQRNSNDAGNERPESHIGQGPRLTGIPVSVLSKLASQNMLESDRQLRSLERFLEVDTCPGLQELESKVVSALKYSNIFKVESLLRRHRSLALKFFGTEWVENYFGFCNWLSSGIADSVISDLLSQVEGISKSINPIDWGKLYIGFFRCMWMGILSARSIQMRDYTTLPPEWSREAWCVIREEDINQAELMLDELQSLNWKNLIILRAHDRDSGSAKVESFIQYALSMSFRVAVSVEKCLYTKQADCATRALNGMLDEVWRFAYDETDTPVTENSATISVALEGGGFAALSSPKPNYLAANMASTDVILDLLSAIRADICETGVHGIILQNLALWTPQCGGGDDANFPVEAQVSRLCEILISQLAPSHILITDSEINDLHLSSDGILRLANTSPAAFTSQLVSPSKLSEPNRPSISLLKFGEDNVRQNLIELLFLYAETPALYCSEILSSLARQNNLLPQIRHFMEKYLTPNPPFKSQLITRPSQSQDQITTFVRTCEGFVGKATVVVGNLSKEPISAMLDVTELLIRIGCPLDYIQASYVGRSTEQSLVLKRPSTEVRLSSEENVVLHVDFEIERSLPENGSSIPDFPLQASSSNNLASTVVPVVLTWNSPASAVYVAGSFDNWRGRVRLSTCSTEVTSFVTILYLKPGNYECKFIVDDDWLCSPSMSHDIITTNNRFTVSEETSSERQSQLNSWRNDLLHACQLPPLSDEIVLTRPVALIWSGVPDQTVCVTGSFDDWTERTPLCWSTAGGQYYWAVLHLEKGLHHYRFLVNGQWAIAEDQPSELDAQGLPSNLVLVA